MVLVDAAEALKPPSQPGEADAELALVARQEAQLRLRLGELLDALATEGGHLELGFPSIDAYALERCGRAARWCQDSRGLARRLRERELDQVRAAVWTGQLSWSKAELVARYAGVADQEALVELARGMTVRELEVRLRRLRDGGEDGAEGVGAKAAGEASGRGGRAEVEGDVGEDRDADEAMVRTRRTIGPAELLLVNASRMLVEFLDSARPSDESLMNALLGEAGSTLLSLEARRGGGGGRGEIPEMDAGRLEAIRARLAELRREREAAAEADMGAGTAPVLVPVPEDPPLPRGPRALDAEIVRFAQTLARRDLRVGELARVVLRSREWCRLGYATAAQYARERVGVSLSTLEHRITLARRAARFPELARGLEAGQLGTVSAMHVGRVLERPRRPAHGEEPGLAAAWVERARRRTVVHLREEVDAVLLRAGLDPTASRMPPDDEALEEVAELERQVLSGELYRSLVGAGRDPQTYVVLSTGTGAELSLRLPPEQLDDWERLERRFHRLAGRDASFVGFMCASLWSTWLPFLEVWDDKWKHIFLRDRHRCTNPVCSRHDVTAHHLEPQSRGGGHEDENVSGLCWTCHGDLLHEGRIQAEPPASKIRWVIGRDGLIEVNGRDKTEGAP